MVTELRREEVLCVEDSSETFQTRLAQLYQLKKNRTFCDVVLQVGNAEIHAHRSVLACASPYFLELFTADDENKTAHEDKLVYKLNGGFEKDSVEHLVKYAYTGKLEVPLNKVKGIYIAASRLKMEYVVDACGSHMVSNLSPETCLSIRALPGIAANKNLVNKIDAFIQDQTDLKQVTREALGIPRLFVQVIYSNQDEAAITSRALCNLVLEWVKKQMEEEVELDILKEKKHLLYLNLDNSLHDCSDIESGAANDTELVQDYKRFSRKLSQPNMKQTGRKVSTAQPCKPRMLLFSRTISDNDGQVDGDWKLIAHSQVGDNSHLAIVTLGGCLAVLSIHQHLNPPVNSEVEISSRPPSVEKVDSYTLLPHMESPKCGSGTGNLNSHLLVCGGYDRGECLRCVELYSPITNKWIKCSDMSQCRGRFNLTVVDGKAYAVGGSSGSKELSSVEVLDSDTFTWSEVASLPLARSNAGVCSLNGMVYCIGGWNGQYGIKQCDVYNPSTNKWSSCALLNIGRYQAGVAALADKVYAVGGCDSWNCLNSVEVYDCAQDVWRFAAPMSTPRRGCGAAVFSGKLYVTGGSDGTQSLCSTEIFDPMTNTWTPGPPMTTCRANVGAAVVDGKLYAIGGFSGKIFLNTIECLDPVSGEWTTFTPKPEYLQKAKLNASSPFLESSLEGKEELSPEEDADVPNGVEIGFIEKDERNDTSECPVSG